MLEQSPDQLGAPTADDLGKCVSGLVNAVARGMEEQIAPWGLSALEFSILGICSKSGRTTVTDLASVIPVDSGRISRIVHKLHQMGYIDRERLVTDRRVVGLELSAEGRNLVPQLVQRVESHNSMLISGISLEEINGFVATAHKIIANYLSHQARLAAEP